jgi:hypothetical protein
MPYALAFGNGHLYAGLRDGDLYASPDAGETWGAVELSGEPLPAILALDSA